MTFPLFFLLQRIEESTESNKSFDNNILPFKALWYQDCYFSWCEHRPHVSRYHPGAR
jgi:hypothetical protein